MKFVTNCHKNRDLACVQVLASDSRSRFTIAFRVFDTSDFCDGDRYKISEAHVVHRREATPGRFTLTTFLCTLQDTTSAQSPYTHPATLDTGRVANAYPGGILTRLSSNHFQSACASVCYAANFPVLIKLSAMDAILPLNKSELCVPFTIL